MATQLNEKPLSHTSANGSQFKADRCDLKNGVMVERPLDISDVQLCADFSEFGAFHSLEIRERLNGFAGYDCISYTITDVED